MMPSLEFMNDMLAHVSTLTYIQIGMFILVIVLLYFVEHLIHYNATLYGMAAIPGIMAATSGAATSAATTTTALLKKKRSPHVR